MGEEPPILASDAEREQSIVLLRDAVTSGRLTDPRLGSRRHAVRALARPCG